MDQNDRDAINKKIDELPNFLAHHNVQHDAVYCLLLEIVEQLKEINRKLPPLPPAP